MGQQGEHHVDNIFLALGSRGRYSWTQVVASNIAILSAAFQLLSNIFICRNVPFECAIPDNFTSTDDNVSVTTEKCDISIWANGSLVRQETGCPYGINYHLPKDASAVSQFDLVCDRANLARLSQTLVIIGQGIGAMISTLLSDRFGRKTVIVASNFGMMFSGLAIAYAPNYIVFAIFKFIVGAFQQGVVTTSATFCIELFPSKDRRIAGAMSGLCWALASISLAPVALLLQNYSWRTLETAYSAAGLFGFFQLWYLDESLRWLMANGKSESAMKVIKRAARMQNKDINIILQAYSGQTDNGTELKSPEDLPLSKDDQKTEENVILSKATKKLSLLDILSVRQLFVNASVMWFAWFTTALAFFTIYLTSSSLSGNRFLNYFLTALMEIPSNIFFYFALNRYGRKFTTVVPFAVLGGGILCTGVFRYLEPRDPIYSTLAVIGSMLSMAGASGSFGIVFFYTPEMFPTNVRNQALGVSSFMGRVGGMLAPFTGLLAEQAIWAPGIVIGCCSCLVCLLLRITPETNGRELPQTVEELQEWMKKPGKKSINGTPAEKL